MSSVADPGFTNGEKDEGVVCGEGIPLPTGKKSGEGRCLSSEIFFRFWISIGDFRCILGTIFYSSVI